jgi:DNA-directed RNA polymerase subunit RPC12/RpoP
MGYVISSGYCPKCGHPVEYDEDTDTVRCTHCDYKQESNQS